MKKNSLVIINIEILLIIKNISSKKAHINNYSNDYVISFNTLFK